MIDRRCLVQFIHPGGEHKPDVGNFKTWNVKSHRRKFLKNRGAYLDGDDTHRGDLVLWGEWEPESVVVERFSQPAAGCPRFLYEPFYVNHTDGLGLQNTDPFVFGDNFCYTGCLQHTERGATQLRHLLPGSVILFGSCIDKSRFVLDTLFVVSGYIDHAASDWPAQVRGTVPKTYETVALKEWYRGNVPEGRTHRLYFGAAPDKPENGMFSFFPCVPYQPGRGFPRPTIDLPDVITQNLSQHTKISRDLDWELLRCLWSEVSRQVQAQGLLLGVRTELPRLRRDPIGDSQRAARVETC